MSQERGTFMTVSTRSLHSVFLAALLVCTGCGTSFVNRGLQEQSRWIQTQVARPATSASDVGEDETRNYETRFEVEVSPSNNRGNAHDAQERSDLPDLRLYTRIGGQRTEVGSASNAQTLTASYPLRLKRGDTVELRLADRGNTYTRVQYDSRQADDWSSESTRETPLAQFSFQFEGPGRYFFHRGYGLFFIDFRQIQ